jgi:hypothetical protein
VRSFIKKKMRTRTRRFVETQHGGGDVTGAQHDDDHNVSEMDIDDDENDE